MPGEDIGVRGDGVLVAVFGDDQARALGEELARRWPGQPVQVLPGTASLPTAAALAGERNCAHLIVLDAAAGATAADLPPLVAGVREHPSAIVLGVRAAADGGEALLARLDRGCANFWVWAQTGVRVGDLRSGARAYPVGLLRRLGREGCREQCATEVIVRALWGEVPLHEATLPRRDLGVASPARGNRARRLLLNARLLLRGLLPWPHLRIVHTAGGDVRITALHPLRSIRLLVQERATPRELGLAVGLGIFLGAVPLIGFHTLAILVAAGLLRVNRLAAVAASQLCMPPVVPGLCIGIGFFIRHGHPMELDQPWWPESFREWGTLGWQILGDWLLGALTFGVLLAIVLGVATTAAAAIIVRARNAHVA